MNLVFYPPTLRSRTGAPSCRKPPNMSCPYVPEYQPSWEDNLHTTGATKPQSEVLASGAPKKNMTHYFEWKNNSWRRWRRRFFFPLRSISYHNIASFDDSPGWSRTKLKQQTIATGKITGCLYKRWTTVNRKHERNIFMFAALHTKRLKRNWTHTGWISKVSRPILLAVSVIPKNVGNVIPKRLNNTKKNI